MKKVLLSLLVCIYALSSFGIGIREFYCCGKLKSVNFSFVQESKENGAKCESDNGRCCKTQHKFFKVKDNHVASYYEINAANHFIFLHHVTPEFKLPVYLSNQITFDNPSHAPPRDSGVPVYISNRVFRI
ncbi:MAG TPA: hypothetical protein VHZ50_07085 [Puia sp.]|jgi:hypothetical protein|nr:hypothetical protein [Puia sp.]